MLFVKLIILTVCSIAVIRALWHIYDNSQNTPIPVSPLSSPSWPSGNQEEGFLDRRIGLNPTDSQATRTVFYNLLRNFPNAPETHTDVVLIGHGSYTGQTFEYRGHPNLREVVMYQPYGAAINDTVVLGISTGDIHPDYRRFYDYNDYFDNRYVPPQNWNRIPSNSEVQVPNVWLSPLELSHLGFRRFENCLYTARQSEDRLLVAYTGTGQSASLWTLATDIAEAARHLGVQVTVHWAACLSNNTSLYDRSFGFDNFCINQYALYRGLMRLQRMTDRRIGDENFWAAIRPFFSGNRGAHTHDDLL